MEQPGLPFDAPYPTSPGFKRAGTSQAAAEAVKPRAKSLRDQVLDLLKAHELTADECAAKLQKSVLAIRPRLSELAKKNLIEDAGRRRFNTTSGLLATVWRAA